MSDNLIVGGGALAFFSTVAFWVEYVRHDYGRIPPTRKITYALAASWGGGWAVFLVGIVMDVIA